ncbi:MAG: prolyl oligopeptidase family serine peptidase [Firmicutes bacterium]|nr:prolyl oligopeptidase family serine peptidase [Bacillota bacterium]
MKKITLFLLLFLCLFLTSCGEKTVTPETRSFAEAHDGFATKLTKQLNDKNEIPASPKGVFNLDDYQTKAGKLAAYVSCDPGDGQKHPLIIWVIGGWGYGISDYFWSYPDWADDQTASGFREAGILMMYPSFRGANGNPGYYETLFGEIDDIAAAYEYAAKLPYVDPNRVYLGGHSTGGTRVLLASEYTDKFRAVFSFGPVDEIKNHNKSQFTFDLNNPEEAKLRSPIYWLSDIKSPTFVIEGADGNLDCLRNMEKATQNKNIHFFKVNGTDHYGTLAPITRLLAAKILKDTGAKVNITLSQQELQEAMKQPPITPMPIMTPFSDQELGVSFLLPAIWQEGRDENGTYFSSSYDGENFWDRSIMSVDVYSSDSDNTYGSIVSEMNKAGFKGGQDVIGGQPGYKAELLEDKKFYRTAIAQKGGKTFLFTFEVKPDYQKPADIMFQKIIGSIAFE